MKTANQIGKLLQYRYRIVTLEGEIVHVGGSLTGGVNKKSNSIILDKMELEKLTNQNINIDNELKSINKDILLNNEKYDNINNKLDGIKRKNIYINEILNIKNNELTNINSKLNEINQNISSTDNILNNNISSEEENILNDYYNSIKEKEYLTLEINNLIMI